MNESTRTGGERFAGSTPYLRLTLRRAAVVTLLSGLSISAAGWAQCGACAGSPLGSWVCALSAPTPTDNGICGGGSLKVCQTPTNEGTRIDIIPGAGGTFEARLVAGVRAQWNSDSSQLSAAKLKLWWQAGGTATHPTSDLCQNNSSDRLETYLRETGLTCAGAPYSFGVYSLRAVVCSGSGCQRFTDFNGLDFTVTKSMLGCTTPLPYSCKEPCKSSSGAAGLQCSACQPVGGDAGCSVGDGNPSCTPSWAGNAQLRYAGSGVGGDSLPGSTAWRTALGLFWSHDYAERVVVDPDTTSPGHVWLLTRYGTFREFSNLAAGSGLRLYQSRAPSDEFRQLYFDTSTSGWQLQSLDGRTDYFRSDGLWDKAVWVQDPSHATQATYNGSNQLTAVSFPDGRSDSFTYHSSGKLASITTVPVSGSSTSSRTWNLTWSGDELVEIERPDGTSWAFTYDSTRPGYLTQVDLVSGSDSRVMAAFSYLSGTNRVEHSWRGHASFSNAAAVDKVSYAYTNPALPTQIVNTRTISSTFDEVTTLVLERDTVSSKPRLMSSQRSCPSCGATITPTTSFAYGGANPLLPSSTTDPKGTRTDFTYDSNGRQLTMVEAANVSGMARTTTYTRDSNFPGLVAQVEVPSTSGGSNKRRTSTAYNATTARLESGTIDGYEGGSALPSGYKVTSYTTNSSGEILTIDPPGYSTNDVTTFTYNLTNRNGHVVDSRADPLVGTTNFDYDGFNRRTSVVDVNGVETETDYDSLDRVLQVRRLGASPPTGNLVTSHTYDAFGDPFCTKLPRGNGIEYTYDGARRLTGITRGTAVSTPSSTSCLQTSEPRERTVYTLDVAGNRTAESRERWSGSAWVSDSSTTYVYTCHLDQTTLGAGSSTPSVTEYCHDLNDNLEKAWDANHPKTTFSNPTQLYAYDELNRLETTTAGFGTSGAATTTYTYDVQDHLSSVTDAESNQTTYTTSDRDLLTQQVSPVSGTTTYTYNEHGQLLTTTDARNRIAERTVDAADRVTQETFGPSGTPDTSLTNTYAYGSTASQFNVGRLVSITRDSQAVSYAYDRFGRMLEDGALTYEYDANGYRTKVTYPGGVSATYTPDFADRDAMLDYNTGSGDQDLVTGASYAASGPLTSLSFANGIAETRGYDERYFPASIEAGTLLDWDYTVDGVGNPTAIGGSLGGSDYSATYGYQDFQYFLTQGDGPWGTRALTYDLIGNRMTFDNSSLRYPLSYIYAGSGHVPQLIEVIDNHDTDLVYDYDAAGNLRSLAPDGRLSSLSLYSTAADNRLSSIGTGNLGGTNLLYDGRGFLRLAQWASNSVAETVYLTPVYGSAGTLFAKTEATYTFSAPPSTPNSETTTRLFYFAGRPVALLSSESGLQYLSTDHLGTPVLGTDGSGHVASQNAGEPFTMGEDESQIIHYPGQWSSPAFGSPGSQGELYYNVHRWYEPQTGRYTQVDPLGTTSTKPYLYAAANPVRLTDPLGLFQRDPNGSCECTPDSDPNDPGRHLPDTVDRACGYLKRPGCADALRNAPINLEPCFQDKCKEPRWGSGTIIQCDATKDYPCGDAPPFADIVVLNRGTHQSCPRHTKEEPPGGPRDFSQTLFHEIGHRCGVTQDDDSKQWWHDVQRICTGWP